MPQDISSMHGSPKTQEMGKIVGSREAVVQPFTPLEFANDYFPSSIWYAPPHFLDTIDLHFPSQSVEEFMAEMCEANWVIRQSLLEAQLYTKLNANAHYSARTLKKRTT